MDNFNTFLKKEKIHFEHITGNICGGIVDAVSSTCRVYGCLSC